MINKRFMIYEVQPRDFYQDCTLSLQEWLRTPAVVNLEPDDNHKANSFIQAFAEVFESGLHEIGESPDIRVSYDFVSDGHFFIFRYRENGRTLIVSPAIMHCGSILIN